jgi:hypothetical protein
VGSFAGPLLSGLDFSSKLVATSVLGGLAAVAGGGKFANGALTAAFGYLFNECANGGCVNGPYANNLIPQGSQREIDQINDALGSLCTNSETACRLINALRNGPEEVFIRIYDGPNRYRADWNMVQYNPNADELGRPVLGGAPPEIALGHEMIHAFHDVYGMMAGSVATEEWNTIGLRTFWGWVSGRSSTGDGPFTENKIRKDYGVPLRPRY